MIVTIPATIFTVTRHDGSTYQTICDRLRVRYDGSATLLRPDGEPLAEKLVGESVSKFVPTEGEDWPELLKAAGFVEGSDGWYAFAEGMNEPVKVSH